MSPPGGPEGFGIQAHRMNGAAMTARGILQLQRLHGNRQVQKMLKPSARGPAVPTAVDPGSDPASANADPEFEPLDAPSRMQSAAAAESVDSHVGADNEQPPLNSKGTGTPPPKEVRNTAQQGASAVR